MVKTQRFKIFRGMRLTGWASEGVYYHNDDKKQAETIFYVCLCLGNLLKVAQNTDGGTMMLFRRFEMDREMEGERAFSFISKNPCAAMCRLLFNTKIFNN